MFDCTLRKQTLKTNVNQIGMSKQLIYSKLRPCIPIRVSENRVESNSIQVFCKYFEPSVQGVLSVPGIAGYR